MPTLAVILLLPLLISLGFWQMHRAVAKQQLLDQFTLRSHQAPQPLGRYEQIYTPVQVTGHYDNTHSILLDNRIVNHQPGYDVIIPFIPADGKPAVLVNLGWIPRSACHQNWEHCLETLSSNWQGQVTIVGLSQVPEHNLVLAHPKMALRWPLLVEDLRLDELSEILNRPLYAYILLLSSGAQGVIPHWDMVTSVTPARHRGYAIQWLALALTLFVLYFKLNIRKIADEP